MPPERSAATTTGVQRLVTRLLHIAVLSAPLGGIAAWSSGSPARGDAPRTRSTGVVVIETDLSSQGNQAAGTGMVLTPSGEVLTNNHVIAGATTIRVVVSPARTYTAKVVGYNVTRDVAVLQLQNASNLKTVSIGNSAALTV